MSGLVQLGSTLDKLLLKYCRWARRCRVPQHSFGQGHADKRSAVVFTEGMTKLHPLLSHRNETVNSMHMYIDTSIAHVIVHKRTRQVISSRSTKNLSQHKQLCA